jgi:hypothetical protein
MPFKEPFDSYYERIYAPAIRDVGLEPRRIDEVFRAGTIIKDIWDHTVGAELLLAELTGRNPNVFYELGLAHAISKPVVLVTQSLDDVPFDLKHLRHIVYGTIDPDWSKKLQADLSKAIRQTLDDPAASLALPSVAVSRDAGSGPHDSEVVTLLKALDSKIDYMRRDSYAIGRFERQLRYLAPPERYRVLRALERGDVSPDELFARQEFLFSDDLGRVVRVKPPRMAKPSEPIAPKPKNGGEKS